ncbi:MAG: hypothetical protein ACYC0V_04395 [Armatimonadota bacterium]
MIRDNDYYTNEFVEGLIEQDRGIWDNLGRAYVRKQEKRYTIAVEKLRETDEGIEKLTNLLYHEIPKIALTAAVFLLETSFEMKAVDVFRRYANRPIHDLDTYAAQQRLADWEKEKGRKRRESWISTISEIVDDT